MNPILRTLLPLALVFAAAAAPADFKVTAPADDSAFRLADARGKYVALHFLLKTECPICLRYTREYAQASATQTNVVHVFLKPDSAEEIKAWTAKLPDDKGPAVTIYRDPDATLAKEFKVPDGYAFHGESVHYPAFILLDPHGKEVFRYIGQNNSDRFRVPEFTAKLTELMATPKAR